MYLSLIIVKSIYNALIITFVTTIKLSIILDYLNDIDTITFLFLNSKHSPFWDIVFSFITGKISWLPLYLFLFCLTAIKYKWKTVYIGLSLAILFGLGDQISVKLFKDVFERLRPCHQPEIAHLVHIINGKCGGRYGFVSSHATNSFALAIYIGLLLKQHYKILLPGLLFWASLVAYSRIYVGVHYPGDIIGGTILGIGVGLFVYWLIKKLNTLFKLNIALNK